jgi:hypothetical protein
LECLIFIGATDINTTDSYTQGCFGDECSLCLSGSSVVCSIYFCVNSGGGVL